MTKPSTTDVPMIDLVVCPHCDNLARIERDSIGSIVDCPHCDRPFPANPIVEPAPLPNIVRAREIDPSERFIPTVHPPEVRGPTETGFAPSIVALLILPWAIPLFWLIGPMVTGHSPVFSFAAPVAIALCASGLGFGIGLAHGWKFATRIRAILALLMLGAFLGGFLFFLKKEWAEAIRKHVGPTHLQWQEFQPSDQSYRINIPGRAVRGNSNVLQWNLESYRVEQTAGRTDKAFEVIYEFAHGESPRDWNRARATEEEWFANIRKTLTENIGGELTSELSVDRDGKWRRRPGREYSFTLPDGTTNRIVQVYRSGNKVFLLAVEGTFIPSDASYVRRFFDSFEIK